MRADWMAVAGLAIAPLLPGMAWAQKQASAFGGMEVYFRPTVEQAVAFEWDYVFSYGSAGGYTSGGLEPFDDFLPGWKYTSIYADAGAFGAAEGGHSEAGEALSLYNFSTVPFTLDIPWGMHVGLIGYGRGAQYALDGYLDVWDGPSPGHYVASSLHGREMYPPSYSYTEYYDELGGVFQVSLAAAAWDPSRGLVPSVTSVFFGVTAEASVPSVTPEPASLALLGTGLVGVIGAARRKRSRA